MTASQFQNIMHTYKTGVRENKTVSEHWQKKKKK